MSLGRKVLTYSCSLSRFSYIAICKFATDVKTPSIKVDYPKDIETHTHQKWEPGDYRMARFSNFEKQVNTRYAIDLIDEIPPKACDGRVVSCDGGGGPLGHPKVYINLDKPGNHICSYCGLRFYNSHLSKKPFDYDNPGV